MPSPDATRSGIDGGANGHDGNGGDGHNGKSPHRPETPTAKIGMWLFAGSLAMIFAALAAWYGYRLDDKPNYYFPWPPSLWVSTLAIVASTFTLWLAQRSAKKGRMSASLLNLRLTLFLGWVFVLSQFVAWLLLRQAGFYATSNPFAGLFYVLTSVHAFHMIFGVGWLIYMFYLVKLGHLTSKRLLPLELFSIYWHLMTGVWIVFFTLIVI
ncbi:MAG: cytochrome c oxidase subunit 3 [Fimbriimonadales bacterium]